MQSKISILYYVKRTKPNSHGHVPIYSRITVDGKRFEMSVNRYIEPNKWSSEANKMRGNTDEARSINSYLDILKGKVYDAQKELIHNNIPVNSNTIKNKVIGVEQRARMLVPIFQEHNDKVETLVGQEFAPGTLERYKTSLKHTIEFIQWKYSVSDIDIKDIDHAFITEYEFFLRSVRKCANNTAIKYIKNFKKIVKLCISNGCLDKDPFVNYKAKIREVEREFLSQEEIQTIYEKVFVTERLNQVKDIFVFACFTGLAYIDVKQLTQSNISIGIDGGKWIFTHRQKTETASKIPILPVTKMIIDKYADHPKSNNEDRLLPILTNQKMNAYLKEIAGVCEI